MFKRKLTSIVILAFNQLEYTKLCIESIYRYTTLPFELILVDNASVDGTGDYFDSIAGAKVIKNSENLGFAKGCNQGIAQAIGDYILLLNNDTVVTVDWLNNLVDCIESDPKIGLVGPCSNNVAGSQFVKARYQSLDEMHEHVREFNRQGRDVWFEETVIIGFCMLVKREVFDAIGVFDERFGLGNYEDNDLCFRAREAGYRLICAANTFVHHFGNRTFIGNDLPYNEIIAKSREVFIDKWSASLSMEDEALMNGRHARGKKTDNFVKGLIRQVDGRHAEALQLFRSAIDSSKENASTSAIDCATAISLMCGGALTEAKNELTPLVAAQHTDIESLLAYADCLLMLGELDAAEKHYKKALMLKTPCVSASTGLQIIEQINSKPELRKFIRDIDALIKMKRQIVKENSSRLTVTYLLEYDIDVRTRQMCFGQANRFLNEGNRVSIIAQDPSFDWPEMRTNTITVSRDDNPFKYIPQNSDIVITTKWPQVDDLVDLGDTDLVYYATGADAMIDNALGGAERGYFELPVHIFVDSSSTQVSFKKQFDREVSLINNAIDLAVFKPGRRRRSSRIRFLVSSGGSLEAGVLHQVDLALQNIKAISDVEIAWVAVSGLDLNAVTCDRVVQDTYDADPARRYTESDIFINIPGNKSSLAPLEAMACGIPVVIVADEVDYSVLADKKNCLAVRTGDYNALYEALGNIIDDQLLRERLIKSGLETAAQFNWQQAIDVLNEKLWSIVFMPKASFKTELDHKTTGSLREAGMTEPGYEPIDSIQGSIDADLNLSRTDIMGLIPVDAKRILDVGCAAGALGKILKSRGAVEVVGIEIEKRFEEEAARNIDRVIIGDVEQLVLDYPDDYFDCIILTGVLECLYNPWQTMSRLKKYLSADGKIICSLLNIGHISIVKELLAGSWRYEDTGILDITHLRFFTLDTTFALLISAGFTVDHVANIIDSNDDDKEFLQKLRESGLASGQYLNSAPAYRFLLSAVPVESARSGYIQPTLHEGEVVSVSQSKRPKLSLAMIVKNEADCLGRCLKSVTGIVDEIIVVDTGSTDNTVDIALQFGAKVVNFDWNDDFSAARNVSLDHATGEWVMFLDADEELVGEDIPKLSELLDDTVNEGFYLDLLNFMGENEEDGAVVNVAFRLWRNKPEYRFTGALHEQILARIQHSNPNVALSGVRINHYGYLNAITVSKNKVKRNMDILLKEIDKYPDDPFVHFNLGVEYLRLIDYEQALSQFQRAFANLSGLDVAYASMLVRNIALCLKELGKYDEALQVLEDAEEAYPDYTDLLYLEGIIHLDRKDYRSASERFKACLTMGPSGKLHISQTGVDGNLAASALGTAYKAMGNEKQAVDSYKHALMLNNKDCSTLAKLGIFLVFREKRDELKEYLESLADTTSEEVLFTLAFVFSQGRHYEISLEYLNRLSNSVSSDPIRLAFAQSECLLNTKRYYEAIEELRKVPDTSVRYAPASVNMALCCLLTGRNKEAIKALDQVKHDYRYSIVYRIYKAFAEIIAGKHPSLMLKMEDGEQAKQVMTDLLGKLLELEEFEAFEAGVGLLRQVLKSDGEMSLVLGKIYHAAEFIDMAVEELVHACELDAADGEAFSILGQAALNNEFYDEANTFLSEALDLGAEELTLYVSLARTLIKLDDAERAKEILDRGTCRFPDSPILDEMRSIATVLVH